MGIVPQLIINSIIAGSIYALVALGFNLIYGATRFFNLTHGVLATVGGYAVFWFAKGLGQNVYVSVIVAVIISGFVGYLTDKFVFRPLRKKNTSGMILLVASLGLFTAIQAVIAIIFTSQFQTLSTRIGSTKVFNVLGGVITSTQVVILVSVVCIFAGLFLLLKKTRFGKAIKAVSDDEEVAKIVGIDTNKIISAVFIIGSAIAGYAGIMVGYDTGIEPTMGMALLLKGVIGAIIGGVGSISGAIAGSYLLGFAENFGIWKISGEWKDAIAFTLLILFLIFRPGGIIKK